MYMHGIISIQVFGLLMPLDTFDIYTYMYYVLYRNKAYQTHDW